MTLKHASRFVAALLVLLLASCTPRDEVAGGERLARDQARADSAAPVVDTIIAEPDSLVLTVGDSIVGSIARLEGRDAAGAILSGFVPLSRVENDSIVAFQWSALVAKRVGTTTITVVPTTFDKDARASAAATRIRVRVVPRAGGTSP